MSYRLDRSNAAGVITSESVATAAHAGDLAQQYVKDGWRDVTINAEFAMSNEEVRALADDLEETE